MVGETNSAEGVLVDFLTPIPQNIGGEPTKEGLIELYRLVSGNAVSVLLNHGGGPYGHLTLTITSEEYAAHTGFAFVPPHNPCNYPPIVGNYQEQGIRTEEFRQNQALFQKYTAVEQTFKSKSSRRWNQYFCPH